MASPRGLSIRGISSLENGCSTARHAQKSRLSCGSESADNGSANAQVVSSKKMQRMIIAASVALHKFVSDHGTYLLQRPFTAPATRSSRSDASPYPSAPPYPGWSDAPHPHPTQ